MFVPLRGVSAAMAQERLRNGRRADDLLFNMYAVSTSHAGTERRRQLERDAHELGGATRKLRTYLEGVGTDVGLSTRSVGRDREHMQGVADSVATKRIEGKLL